MVLLSIGPCSYVSVCLFILVLDCACLAHTVCLVGLMQPSIVAALFLFVLCIDLQLLVLYCRDSIQCMVPVL